MNDALLVFITAATPVVELRGAIPVGLALDMPVLEVYILSVIGNILPVPFILLGMNYLLQQLKKIPRVHSQVQHLRERGGNKLYVQIQRWGWLGLLLFVAIPLPGTGAWTGSMAASFLRLKFWPTFFTVIIGICVAGLIVSSLSLGVISIII